MRTIIFSLLALLLIVVPSAFAHHYKGLPHYGYFENYPQVPYLEHIKETPNYEIFVAIYNFQGFNMDKVESPKDVRFYIYIFNTQTNKSYIKPAKLKITSHNKLVFESDRKGPEEENIYIIQTQIKEQDNLMLSVEIEKENGELEKIEFPISITKSFFAKFGIGVSVLIFFILVGSVKTFLNLKKSKNEDANG